MEKLSEKFKDLVLSKKTFPVLYKYTQTGSTQQWQIIAANDYFYTIEGIKDGKLTTSKPTYCKGKNIGKKNETTDYNQAIAEAAAKHQKKLDKGYNEVLTATKKFFEPMLAHDYKEQKSIDFKAYRVFVQPKLDGLRCISENDTLMSRNGKPYNVPHLYQNGVMLDGELYNHELKNDFNKIVSLCKKKEPTEDEYLEQAEKVKFFAYDFPEHKGVFSERYEALKNWFDKESKKNKVIRDNIVIVETHEVKNEEEIKEWHEKLLGLGYEGTIVRLNNSEYETKRSKSLLKYKDFVDEEFEIVGFEEGTGGRAGTIGKFILKHDKDPNKTFDSNVKGNFAYLTKIWKDRKKYVGKMATVKYFRRTPADVPRFPYIIKLDRNSYE